MSQKADTASSGDGLGGGLYSGAGAAADRSQVDLGSFASDMMKTHGVPTRLRQAVATKHIAKINALVGATSAQQKEAVVNALVYVSIVNGTGPLTDFAEIRFEPPGCKAVTMNQVVDGIVTRKYFRRFMRNYSARALEMFDASPELQESLTDRCVRDGIPLTEKAAVIDFLDNSTGIAPSTAMYRTKNKYAAVARANRNGSTALDHSSAVANDSMREGNDADRPGDSLGGL